MKIVIDRQPPRARAGGIGSARARFLVLLFLLAAVAASGLVKAAQVSIGPARSELKVAPASETTIVVDAVNHADEPLHLKVFAADFDLSETGEMQYAGTPGPRSCSGWFRLNPQALELGRSETGNVRATLTAPPEARGTYWCVVFLEDVPPPLPKRSQRRSLVLQMNARLGSVVYVDVQPEGTSEVPALGVESLSATSAEAGKIEAEAVIVHRTGGYLRPQASWELSNGAGAVVATSDVGFPLLPAHRYRLRWTPEAPSGRYIVRLKLDYGGATRLAAETSVTVPPKEP